MGGHGRDRQDPAAPQSFPFSAKTQGLEGKKKQPGSGHHFVCFAGGEAEAAARGVRDCGSAVGLCSEHRVSCVSPRPQPRSTWARAAPRDEAWPRGAAGCPHQLPESEPLPGWHGHCWLSDRRRLFLPLLLPPHPIVSASSSSDGAGGWQQQPWVGRALGWVSGTFLSPWLCR